MTRDYYIYINLYLFISHYILITCLVNTQSKHDKLLNYLVIIFLCSLIHNLFVCCNNLYHYIKLLLLNNCIYYII